MNLLDALTLKNVLHANLFKDSSDAICHLTFLSIYLLEEKSYGGFFFFMLVTFSNPQNSNLRGTILSVV